MKDADCLFCKIIDCEVPSEKVFEDAQVYAFKDINPKAKVLCWWCLATITATSTHWRRPTGIVGAYGRSGPGHCR